MAAARTLVVDVDDSRQSPINSGANCGSPSALDQLDAASCNPASQRLSHHTRAARARTRLRPQAEQLTPQVRERLWRRSAPAVPSVGDHRLHAVPRRATAIAASASSACRRWRRARPVSVRIAIEVGQGGRRPQLAQQLRLGVGSMPVALRRRRNSASSRAAGSDAQRSEIPAILAVVLRRELDQRVEQRRRRRRLLAHERRPASCARGSWSRTAISRRTCGDGSRSSGRAVCNTSVAPAARRTRSASTRKRGIGIAQARPARRRSRPRRARRTATTRAPRTSDRIPRATSRQQRQRRRRRAAPAPSMREIEHRLRRRARTPSSGPSSDLQVQRRDARLVPGRRQPIDASAGALRIAHAMAADRRVVPVRHVDASHPGATATSDGRNHVSSPPNTISSMLVR